MGTRFDDPRSQSRALFERARRVIPGGTSKANLHVRPHPFYLAEGRGCRVTDVDGVERLDAVNNFTALIHGHAFPPVVDGVSRQLGETFSANPVSMTAGLATMRAMTPAEFDRLDALGARLRARLADAFRRAGVPGQATGEGSLFRLLFTDRPLRSYRDVDQAAEARMAHLFRALLDAGVLLHTTGLGCLSTPMGDQEVEELAAALERALTALAGEQTRAGGPLAR